MRLQAKAGAWNWPPGPRGWLRSLRWTTSFGWLLPNKPGYQEERKQAQESIQALDLPEIKFKSQSFDLTEAGTRVLDVVSGVLTRYPKVRVEIGGHTDSQGEESVNLRLSKQRASSVHRYLISRGIDPDRLEVQGYGESIALAENDTPEGRARNRRIEFKVIQ